MTFYAQILWFGLVCWNNSCLLCHFAHIIALILPDKLHIFIVFFISFIFIRLLFVILDFLFPRPAASYSWNVDFQLYFFFSSNRLWGYVCHQNGKFKFLPQPHFPMCSWKKQPLVENCSLLTVWLKNINPYITLRYAQHNYDLHVKLHKHENTTSVKN
jgi:hypothetical protein